MSDHPEIKMKIQMHVVPSSSIIRILICDAGGKNGKTILLLV